MTSLKVRQIGNSLGVVLPKEVLTRLNITDGDVLYLTDLLDNSIQITSFDPAFEDQMKAAEEIMEKYSNTLRELAK